MKRIEMVILDTEEEYKNLYRDTFLEKELLFHDIPISFLEEDFEHIFYEPKAGGGYAFSKRRAKRMLFIVAILVGSVQRELFYQEDRGTFAVFCPDLECVVYLRIRPRVGGVGILQIATFFDFGRDHEKMCKKQKKKCSPVTLLELKDMLNADDPLRGRSC